MNYICKLKVVCLSAALLLPACKQNHRTNEVPMVSFTEVSQMKASEIIHNYTVVKLETREDNLFAYADIIRMTEDKILVGDLFSPKKSIYAFRKDGTYISKVGGSGQGPGEYIGPMEALVDEKGQLIYVWDAGRNKILAYDIHTLAFRKENALPFYVNCMEILPDQKMIFYIGKGVRNEGVYTDHFQITDMNGQWISSFIPRETFQKYNGSWQVTTYFHKAGEEVYAHQPFQATEMRCSAAGVEPAYTLNFSNHSFAPMSVYEKAPDSNSFINLIRDEGYIHYHEVWETRDKIYVYFGVKKNIYIGIYDKRKKKGVYCRRDAIVDDIGIGVIPRVNSVWKNQFIAPVIREDFNPPADSDFAPYASVDPGKAENPLVLLFE